jgi:hypothetical protein
MRERRSGISSSFAISTPFIPLVSFKASREKAYDHFEEDSVWDEKVMRDSGVFIKQKNFYIVGQQIKEALSFIGGRVLSESPALGDAINRTEKFFGNFKYSYQSNWGQEHRLRSYIKKVQSLTGLTKETCATVPAFKDSLGFNQVSLELNLSDEYIREIISFDKSKVSLLNKIKTLAQNYQSSADEDKSNSILCENSDNGNNNCLFDSSDKVENIFKNLETYASNMNNTLVKDQKEFSRNLSKFGEEIWKSPAVFKAFYEKGKVCGQEFKYEISGQRITRHLIDQRFVSSAACTSL